MIVNVRDTTEADDDARREAILLAVFKRGLKAWLLAYVINLATLLLHRLRLRECGEQWLTSLLIQCKLHDLLKVDMSGHLTSGTLLNPLF